MRRSTESHSHTKHPGVYLDANAVAQIEARNALRQFDAAMRIVDDCLCGKRAFKLRPSDLLEMNRLAVDGLMDNPGSFRTESVVIHNSQHTPPETSQVPSLVDDLCDYINDHWKLSPFHLSAYLMWRINWIHPFGDGNGRTSRIISYMVLCIRLDHKLPGSLTIPAQIADDRNPYYDALDQADAAWKNGQVDVSAMEQLLSSLLARQLYVLHQQAKE